MKIKIFGEDFIRLRELVQMRIRRGPVGCSVVTYRTARSLFLSLRELKGENSQVGFRAGERPSG